MGFPASEVGYTSATTGRGDHEARKEHVVALKTKSTGCLMTRILRMYRDIAQGYLNIYVLVKLQVTVDTDPH
jgi:hypothetical protein